MRHCVMIQGQVTSKYSHEYPQNQTASGQEKWLGRLTCAASGSLQGALALAAGGATAIAIAGPDTVNNSVGASMFVASVGSAASAVVLDRTKKYLGQIAESERNAYRIAGASLLIGFSLACGAGNVFDKEVDVQAERDATNGAAILVQAPSSAQIFSIADLEKEGCFVEFDGTGQARVKQGDCALLL